MQGLIYEVDRDAPPVSVADLDDALANLLLALVDEEERFAAFIRYVQTCADVALLLALLAAAEVRLTVLDARLARKQPGHNR